MFWIFQQSPWQKDSDNSEQRNNNYLQLAIRSRIKFFFRPAHLKLTPNDAYLKVTRTVRKAELKQLIQHLIT